MHDRLPPAGFRLSAAAVAGLWPGEARGEGFRAELAARLGAKRVDFTASGSEALRRALIHFAARSGRDEVVVPAYTCYTVPAAAVAAGLRVRLVDVTPDGRIDAVALARLPLDRAAAVITCNLFGIADPIEPLRLLARDAGAALIDDAAQALGATSPWGPAGGRGEVGILSFSRGKPLPGLGGGALVWCEEAPEEVPPVPALRPATALLRALAHDLVLSPRVFGWVASIPALRVGETHFDPEFPHGGIPGEALALASAVLPRADAEAQRRAGRAREIGERLRATTRLEPVLASAQSDAVYPRLAVLAADEEERDAALAALSRLGSGAARLYPRSLDAVDALRAHRADPGADQPGARALAARLLTLPTHAGFCGARAERAFAALGRLADARNAVVAVPDAAPDTAVQSAAPGMAEQGGDESASIRPAWRDRLSRLARFVRSAEARHDLLHEGLRRLRGEPALPLAPCGRILVLCKGNLCRSPFAGELLARVLPGTAVASAGLAASGGDPAEPGAIRGAARFGIDLRAHRTRRADEAMLAAADLILVMEAHQAAAVAKLCPQAAPRTRCLGDYLERGPYRIDDPWGRPDSFFDETFARIARALERLSGRLAAGRHLPAADFTPIGARAATALEEAR